MKSINVVRISSKFNICLRTACGQDMNPLRHLLAQNRPYVSQHTIDTLETLLSYFFLINDKGGDLIAAVACIPCRLDGQANSALREIRGLVVAREYRDNQIASYLVRSVIEKSETAEDFVCVTRNTRFFKRLGFKICEPFWLQEDREISTPQEKCLNTTCLFPERKAMILRS